MPPMDRAEMGAEAEHFVLEDHELDDEERGHSQLRPERESNDDDDGSPGYGGKAASDRRYSYDVDDDADEIEDEKRFKYFQELPNARDLRDSRPKIPGAFPIASGLALLVCVGYLIAWICTSITRYSHVTKVNVILMVSDGFGPASETFAREYLQYLVESDHPSIQKGGRWASLVPESGPTDYRMTLPLDSILIGSSRTRSSDSLVTDSAAGATAFSCALKTYNGAIGVEPNKRDPCGTVLEAAKHQGYQTGLVVTSRITHATPASFYAHVPDRDMEAKIAEQLVLDHPLGQQVDLAFGGGLCFFLPNTSTTSCRTDDKDLIEAAKNKRNNNPRLSVITSRKEFDDLPADASSIGTIGLFNRDHMEYEIDRLAMSDNEGEREPTLADMAEKAIRILRASVSRSNAHGFFLMIEGSRIDMAGHSNDPVGHVHEILSYQATVQKVQAQIDEMNAAGNPSLLISVSDHETGGLSLGRQLDTEVYPTYAWYPDALVNGSRTSVKVAQAIRDQADTIDIEGVRSLLQSQLGVSDADDEEIAAVLKDKDDTTLWFLDHTLSKLTSRRAQVGWSTEGHSGVDVNLYGYPRALVAPSLGGSRENTEIGVFIATTMKLNLKQITKSLQNNIKTWYNSTSPKLDSLSVNRGHGTGSVAHYHGEHRH